MSRRILIKLTALGVAIVFACVTYVLFSARNTATQYSPFPPRISLSKIPPGNYIEVEWRNRPVIVFRPDDETKRELIALNDVVHGPTFPFQENRVFIYERVSTNRGCGAVYRTASQRPNIEGIKWFGGWIDPCHYGAWDNAGRAYIRKPETDPSSQLPNLNAPAWRFLSEDTIELL